MYCKHKTHLHIGCVGVFDMHEGKINDGLGSGEKVSVSASTITEANQ